MINAVHLNNKGYDPFIDFMKGLCIICVVLTHSIPYEWQQIIGFPFWGAQAVPIFLLIQSYHYFKNEELPPIKWRKLFKRIVLPFVLVQTVIVLYIFVAYFCGSGMLTTPLLSLIMSGGEGPGSYYIWIYIQFALIFLPLCGWFQKKVHLSDIQLGIIFIIVSEGLEILCSYWHPNNLIYRLLAFRYVFLIYGGYLWAQHGIKCNLKTITLSLLSIIVIYMLQYKHYTFEPWLFDTPWSYFHWCSYFLAIFLLMFIANVFYKYILGGDS